MIIGRVLGKYHVDWDVETDEAIDPALYALPAEGFLEKIGYFNHLDDGRGTDDGYFDHLLDEWETDLVASLKGYCRNGFVTVVPEDDHHFKIVIRYDS